MVRNELNILGFPESVKRCDLGVRLCYLSTSKNTLVQYSQENHSFYKSAINESGLIQIQKEILAYKRAPLLLTPNYKYDIYGDNHRLITEPLSITKTTRLTLIHEFSSKLRLDNSEKHIRKRLSELIRFLIEADDGLNVDYGVLLKYENWDNINSGIEHGDFNYWNIGRSESGDLKLIDWEYVNYHGIFGIDFVQYCFYRYCARLPARTAFSLLRKLVSKFDYDNKYILLFIARELEAGKESRKLSNVLSICVRKF
ncbi:hypothetical protein N9P12_02235 [Bacteroidia bacterium]|nr:hypothetical protein [Bacteroidia bacterium]